QEDALVFQQRMLQRPGRRRPTDHEGHHHVGEDHDVPQRDYGQRFVHFQGGFHIYAALSVLLSASSFFTLPAGELGGGAGSYPAFSTNVMGLSFARTTSRVIVTSRTFFCVGTWYIRSNIRSSMIIRSPRAPIFRSSADSAIASRASSVKRSFTFSYSKSFMYCRVIALRGCVRIWMRAGLS